MAKIPSYPAIVASALSVVDQFVLDHGGSTRNMTVAELNKQWVTKSGNSSVNGTITAAGFVGNGAGLTGVVSTGVGGSSSTGSLSLIANSDGSTPAAIIAFMSQAVEWARLDGGHFGLGASPLSLFHISDTEAAGGVTQIIQNIGDGGISTTPFVSIKAMLSSVRNGGEIIFGRDSTYGSEATSDSHILFLTSLNDVNAEVARMSSGGGFYLAGLGGADVDITGKGQFWVATATGLPMFTGDDGVDHTLAYV